MREVNVKIPVYKYEELTNTAKGIVKDDYLANNRTTTELDIRITTELAEIGFYDIDVSFNLAYCQGDGLSFTAKISSEDLFKIESLTDRLDLSAETIASLKDTLDYIEFIRIDHRYSHYNTCKAVLNGDLTWMSDKDYNYFYDDITRYYQRLCRRFESVGYRWFYEVEEDEVIAHCNDNNLEFTSDGRIFNRTLETT